MIAEGQMTVSPSISGAQRLANIKAKARLVNAANLRAYMTGALDILPCARDIERDMIAAEFDRLAAPDCPSDIIAALVAAFPHFQHPSPGVTVEGVQKLGKEWLDMVMGWAPVVSVIDFIDHNGDTRQIIDEPGEFDEGIRGGWTLCDADAEAFDKAAQEAVRMREALADCKRLFDEALPKFNWGASALDANAIKLLNDVPIKVNALVPPPPPPPYRLNEAYRTLGGEYVMLVSIANAGTTYETMACEHGVHRYTARADDHGRVTGTPTDPPDPRNLVYPPVTKEAPP